VPAAAAEARAEGAGRAGVPDGVAHGARSRQARARAAQAPRAADDAAAAAQVRRDTTAAHAAAKHAKRRNSIRHHV